MRRIVVPSTPTNPSEQIAQVLKLTDELCKADVSTRRVILYVPSKNMVSGTSLEAVLGSDRIKTLIAGKALRLGNVNLELVGQTTLTRGTRPDAVVALFTDSELLDKLHICGEMNFLIVAPWNDDDIAAWARAWNPEVLGVTPIAQPVPRPPQDDLLEKVLERLTRSINLSTGLAHPSDKARTIDLFWHLRQAGVRADPDAVRAWAVGHGWPPHGADELKKVVERTNSRKSAPKEYGQSWNPGVIDDIRRGT